MMCRPGDEAALTCDRHTASEHRLSGSIVKHLKVFLRSSIHCLMYFWRTFDQMRKTHLNRPIRREPPLGFGSNAVMRLRHASAKLPPFSKIKSRPPSTCKALSDRCPICRGAHPSGFDVPARKLADASRSSPGEGRGYSASEGQANCTS